jgi:cytochrome c
VPVIFPHWHYGCAPNKEAITSNMKNVIISLICTIIFGCNSNNEKYSNSTSSTDSLINSAGNIADSNYREGARLIAANDCFTCHRVEQKIVGPSYREVAAKYHFNEGNVENLSHSIVYGSKGLWGNKEMTAHSTLDPKDAKEMARYILSLDTTDKGNQ